MKILHTADWHIGKQLLKEDLYNDHLLFFDFLIETIEFYKVDVLLISGDIFDLANPSNQSKKLYLDLLGRLKRLKDIKVIVTAGNHDSISYLESSREILSLLDITIVGDLEHVELIPIEEEGSLKVVVVPIPFLNDRVLRKGAEMSNEEERIAIVKESLIEVFTSWSLKAKELYSGVPIIGMGHLYLQGASISDSERQIQIGNMAGIEASGFDKLYDYLALGHIHKPQVLSPRVRYSGSPIALSFSERSDNKVMVILDIQENEILQTSIAIPKIRNLVKINGTLEEVISKVKVFVNDSLLPAFVELDILEEKEDPSKILELKAFEAEFESDQLKILKSRLTFTNQTNVFQSPTVQGLLIDELTPGDVFKKKLVDTSLSDEDSKMVTIAFQELLDEVLNPSQL